MVVEIDLILINLVLEVFSEGWFFVLRLSFFFLER